VPSTLLLLLCCTVGAFNPPSLRPTQRSATRRNKDMVTRKSSLTRIRDGFRSLREELARREEMDQAFDLKRGIMQIGAACDRGQQATTAQRQDVMAMIERLERLSPTQEPSRLLEGTWRLVYSGENPTRSSPFWWATRQLFGGVAADLLRLRDLVESAYRWSDMIPVTRTGEAVQMISGLSDGEGVGSLVNRMRISVSGAGSGIFETTATVQQSRKHPEVLRLDVETEKITDSWVPYLSNVVFPTQRVYERFRRGAAELRMTTTYIDDDIRISRYLSDEASREKDFVYVYSRV